MLLCKEDRAEPTFTDRLKQLVGSDLCAGRFGRAPRVHRRGRAVHEPVGIGSSPGVEQCDHCVSQLAVPADEAIDLNLHG
ncbi:MAG: hypothetical protein ACTS22_10400 [Phycisphaerales bacterium]